MAFGTKNDDTDDVMNEINIDLPRASNQQLDIRAQTVSLSIDADGTYFWNNKAIEDAQGAAAGAAYPRRQARALRMGCAGDGDGAALRHPQDRVHHRTQTALTATMPAHLQ